MLQSYLAVGRTVDGVIDDAELDWQTERQARFAASNVLDALSPDARSAVLANRVRASDVSRIRNHPLVPATISIYGYIYDVKTGRLVEVERATDRGRASTS